MLPDYRKRPPLSRCWYFAVSCYFAFTPLPRWYSAVRKRSSRSVAAITILVAVSVVLSLWHFYRVATDGNGRVSLYANGLAAIGTLLAAGVALYVALIGQERSEEKEHTRNRPVLSARITWHPVQTTKEKSRYIHKSSPPYVKDPNSPETLSRIAVEIHHEWGEPCHAIGVYIRGGRDEPEASTFLFDSKDNPILLTREQPFRFERSMSEGLAPETALWLHVRFFDILYGGWETQAAIFLSLIGDAPKVRLSGHSHSVLPDQETTVPLPMPTRSTDEMFATYGPQLYKTMREQDASMGRIRRIWRRIGNLWFNSKYDYSKPPPLPPMKRNSPPE